MKKKRVVSVSVLPGEPLNGAGRVCIHLFVPDGTGPNVERSVTQLGDAPQEEGRPAHKRLTTGPTRGHLACDPKKRVAPTVRNGVTSVTMRTIEPGAVTCPACKKSSEYDRLMKLLAGPSPAVAAEQESEQEDGSRSGGPSFGTVHGDVERLIPGDAE